MIIFLFIMLLSQLPDDLLLDRMIMGELARTNLMAYARLNTPDPYDPLNVRKSKYQWKEHHELICSKLEKLEAGKIKALEIQTPPRWSKSTLAVHDFVPWYAAKHTGDDLIVVTATAELALEHGREVRDIIRSPGHILTFGHDPLAQLRDDSQSANRLQLVGGAIIHFYGRGQIPRGVGGHGLVIDDLFKSSDQAVSATERDTAYRNVISDCYSRLNSASAWKLMIGTRNHADDVQGRMFDPTNPHYDAESAKQWVRIRIPALSEGKDVDPIGRELGESGWPERFPTAFYVAKKNHASEIQRMDFQTQDQCNPTPEEGQWFKAAWLKNRYDPAKPPAFLRNYVASDHAYRIKQKNDKTCILKVGISPDSDIYISPQTWWKRAETDVIADEVFDTIKNFKPAGWWAARDAISGSMMPFLRRRMLNEKVFFYIDDTLTETRDLVQRSASIRGYFAMGKVYFPSGWADLEAAIKQLIEFPGGSDDFVGALAILGMGLDKMTPAEGLQVRDVPKKGTLAWHTYGQNKTPEHAPASWWKG
jgi:hypothetical protein